MVASAPRRPARRMRTISSKRSTCAPCFSVRRVLSGVNSLRMMGPSGSPHGWTRFHRVARLSRANKALRKRASENMKALFFRAHGGPEVLECTDSPEPTIGHNDVLVRVRACALNHLDLWVRRGLPGVTFPLPHIPGSHIAGEIAAIGPGVTLVKVGQKVVLAPGVSCGKCAACVAGLDNRCRQFTNLGYMIDGGCAEFVRVPEVNCLPFPENLSFEEAAAVPLVFQTAWHMLVGRAELQPGEEVLILGAGSGVGVAAIQIAKFFGARVIATAGSEEKLAKAKKIGADETIQHHKEKIRDSVK